MRAFQDGPGLFSTESADDLPASAGRKKPAIKLFEKSHRRSLRLISFLGCRNEKIVGENTIAQDLAIDEIPR
jgi:hypothetical protein